MAVFRDRSIEDVVAHLGLTLPGTGPLAKIPIPVTRKRLGPAPMKHLFHRVAGMWANAERVGDYRGLTLLGIDGTCMSVQDSDANFEHSGKPIGRDGEGGGYPQLRLAALLNLGTRMVTDMEFGALETSEVAPRVDHDEGRQNLAILMTMVWTGVLHGVAPRAHPAGVIVQANCPGITVNELLPWDWKPEGWVSEACCTSDYRAA